VTQDEKNTLREMFAGQLISEEETAQMETFIEEAWERATSIREMFGSTGRDFMLYMMAIYILQWNIPEIFKAMERTPIRVKQWFAAGQPDDLLEVPKMLLARILKETEQQGSETIQ
jgi:hypothetical protein